MVLFLLLPLLLPTQSFAQTQNSDPQLRRALETNYADWQRSLLRHDLDAWTRAIAPSRRVMTRNLILSQRQPWPAALFSLPFRPPSLSSLRFLKAEANPEGTAAIAVYFGVVDLGLAPPSGGSVPENLFLLHYIREPNKPGASWKFDRTALLSLGPDTTPDGQPGLRSRIARGGERDFLDEPAFRPYASAPPTPPSVERIPDYVAHLSVASPGYHTRVRINGDLHESHTIDETTRDIVIGGLREGKNEIEITTTPLLQPEIPTEPKTKVVPGPPDPADATTPPSSTVPNPNPPAVKIEVQVIRDAENLPPVTIFTYAPETPPATHTAPLWANAVTLQ